MLSHRHRLLFSFPPEAVCLKCGQQLKKKNPHGFLLSHLLCAFNGFIYSLQIDGLGLHSLFGAEGGGVLKYLRYSLFRRRLKVFFPRQPYANESGHMQM